MRSALAVPVVDRAVGAVEHHVVLGVARPDADLLAVGVDGHSGLARAREHHHPGRGVPPVGRVVGAPRTGREADDLAAAELLLSIDAANDDGALEYEKPLLLVLVVIRAHGLPRRQLIDLDRQRLAARRLADAGDAGAEPVGVIRVVVAPVAESV